MARQTRRGIRDEWVQYVRGTITESGANTYTEATVNMPVVVAQGFVLEVHTIEFTIPPLVAADVIATSASVRRRCQLTKSSQSALISIDGPNLIASHDLQTLSADIQTAEEHSGVNTLLMGRLLHAFEEPILLPFEQIYFAAHSAGYGAAAVYTFRIGYKTVKLSTRQLPELVQAVT